MDFPRSIRHGDRAFLALLFRALELGAVSKVAPIDKLSVVVAIALAVAFLGEKLGPREGIGAGLIVLGAISCPTWK